MAQQADDQMVREDVFVALGTNLGDRLANLRGAVEALREVAGITVVRPSPVYEVEAHTLDPAERQPPYLNAVVQLHTNLDAEPLLDQCLAIEKAFGRSREASRRWAPRPLDLDVIAYGQRRCTTPQLTLPHPRLHERRFVLQPLADLAPHFYLPAPYEKTVAELLTLCAGDVLPVRTALSLK